EPVAPSPTATNRPAESPKLTTAPVTAPVQVVQTPAPAETPPPMPSVPKAAPVVAEVKPQPPKSEPSKAPAMVFPDPRPLDPARVASAGLRRVEGKRLVLFTDLPPSAEIDSLVDVFEQAYPQWCQYFGRTEMIDQPWRMHGFLMKDKA